jgi:hypothetical protein
MVRFFSKYIWPFLTVCDSSILTTVWCSLWAGEVCSKHYVCVTWCHIFLPMLTSRDFMTYVSHFLANANITWFYDVCVTWCHIFLPMLTSRDFMTYVSHYVTFSCHWVLTRRSILVDSAYGWYIEWIYSMLEHLT